MVLNKLSECYDLLKASYPQDIPDIGYSIVQVAQVIEIDDDGMIHNIIPIEKTKMIVPFQKKRSGVSPTSYFLCDVPKYILGKQYNKETDKIDSFQGYFENTYNLHLEILKSSTDKRAVAVAKFFENIKNNVKQSFELEPLHCQESKIVFKLINDEGYLHEEAVLKELWNEYLMKNIQENSINSQCLVSGKENQLLQKTHNAVSIIGGQSAGASLVSFNLKAFESYNKKQSLNSPVSFEEMFKYTTSLQYLLNSRRNKCYLNGQTCVFWTSAGNESVETYFLNEIFSPSIFKDLEQKDDVTPIEMEIDLTDVDLDNNDFELAPTNLLETTHDLMKSIVTCQYIHSEEELLAQYRDTNVYILCLDPNAARIAVKFFYINSFGNFVKNIQLHYERLALENTDEKYQYLSIESLLKASTRTGSLQDCTNALKDKLIASILYNHQYPSTLFYQCIHRYIVDQREIVKDTHKEIPKLKFLNKSRVAFIKAYLIKEQEQKKTNTLKKEAILMSLNTENLSIGYNLGRLFAVLEKIQFLAGNKTLSERYFSGACTTPKTMFVSLMKNSQNHLAKIHKDNETAGLAIFYEKLIGEILSHMQDGFPAHLSQKEQGLFILGYYQQKETFYTKQLKGEDEHE